MTVPLAVTDMTSTTFLTPLHIPAGISSLWRVLAFALRLKRALMPNSEHLISLYFHVHACVCEWLFIHRCARACGGPRSRLGSILGDSSTYSPRKGLSVKPRAWDTVSLSSHFAPWSESPSLRRELQVGYHGYIPLIISKLQSSCLADILTTEPPPQNHILRLYHTCHDCIDAKHLCPVVRLKNVS